MLGQYSPIDPAAQFADRIKALDARITGLEQLLGQSPAWRTLTLADANWTLTRTPEWRVNRGRVELRGRIDRITSALSAGASTAFINLGIAGNPPAAQDTHVLLMRQYDASAGTGIVNAGVATTSALRLSGTAGVSVNIDVGDALWLDSITWPI